MKNRSEIDAQYDAALKAFRIVSAKHNKVTLAYRDRTVGDAEFLASRAELRKAHEAFDVAETEYIAACNE